MAMRRAAAHPFLRAGVALRSISRPTAFTALRSPLGSDTISATRRTSRSQHWRAQGGTRFAGTFVNHESFVQQTAGLTGRWSPLSSLHLAIRAGQSRDEVTDRRLNSRVAIALRIGTECQQVLRCQLPVDLQGALGNAGVEPTLRDEIELIRPSSRDWPARIARCRRTGATIAPSGRGLLDESSHD